MNTDDLFTVLEKNFLSYHDLKSIPVIDNNENMVPLRGKEIHFTVSNNFISPSTGEDIYVRESIVSKLREAQDLLDQLFSGCIIDVIYGYRSSAIQKENYLIIKNNLLAKHPTGYSENDINAEIHRFIAIPDVAGHPTGGAIDVRLLDYNGNELNMGTKAHEFVKESYSFYPLVTKEVWFNRQKLRQCMLAVGFAPFDGEWWHFSYGDKEWAAYYKKPNALYKQLEIESFEKIMHHQN